MKVKELIEVLKRQPQENEVVLCMTYDCGHSIVKGDVLFVERNEFYSPGITSIWNDEG